MEVDGGPKGEGFRSYYITKIEELQLIVAEKSQNLRRLQAQRNELNAKGNKDGTDKQKLSGIWPIYSSRFYIVLYSNVPDSTTVTSQIPDI